MLKTIDPWQTYVQRQRSKIIFFKQLLKIEGLQNTDITGKHKHSFKRNRSTSTLALQLQSLIARVLEEDNFIAMASLDLSAAFDVVNM